MDRPDVSWKFFESFREHVITNYHVQCLNLGSCGLHIAQNAYKAGLAATKCGSELFL